MRRGGELLGFNVYRGTEVGGAFTRLNAEILNADAKEVTVPLEGDVLGLEIVADS